MKKEDEEAFLKEIKEKTDVKSMQKEKKLGRKMFGELEDVLSWMQKYFLIKPNGFLMPGNKSYRRIKENNNIIAIWFENIRG